MNITFFNDCEYVVHLSIGSRVRITIQPYSMLVVNGEKNDSFICIKRNILSFKKRNKYTLVLETQYKVTNIHNNDIFRITHKKVCIDGNVYYDKLFLNSETAICNMEKNNVLGAEEIKKKFRKSRIRYRLFISPFEHLTGLTILLIIFGVALGYKFGGILLMIYFLVAYLFLIVLDWAMEKINQFVFHKAFGVEDEKTEFYHFFENKFIMKYFGTKISHKGYRN